VLAPQRRAHLLEVALESKTRARQHSG
jgi:hypothetical protein